MRCRNCGAELYKGDVFCRRCGEKAVAEEIQETGNARGAMIAVAAIVVCAAIATGAAAFFFFGGHSAKEEPDAAVSTQDTNPQSSNSQEQTPSIEGEQSSGASESAAKNALGGDLEEVFSAFEDHMMKNSYTTSEYMSCGYFYIDEDNVPELLMDVSGDGSSTKLLCYRDGEVIESDIWARGDEAYYKEKQNVLILRGSQWNADGSYENCDAGHLEDGEFVLDNAFEKTIGIDANGDETYRSCMLNTREMDEDRFDKKLEKLLEDPELEDCNYAAYPSPEEAKEAFLRENGLAEAKKNDEMDEEAMAREAVAAYDEELKKLSKEDKTADNIILIYFKNDVYPECFFIAAPEGRVHLLCYQNGQAEYVDVGVDDTYDISVTEDLATLAVDHHIPGLNSVDYYQKNANGSWEYVGGIAENFMDAGNPTYEVDGETVDQAEYEAYGESFGEFYSIQALKSATAASSLSDAYNYLIH